MEIGESNPPKIPFGTDMETLDSIGPGMLPGMEEDPLGPPVNSTIENFTDNFINTTWIFGPTEDKVILPLLLSLIALCAFLANGLVMFTILAYQRMRTGPNLMIMNIAVADVVFAAICIPTAIINHSLPGDDYPVNVTICKFVHYVIFVTIYVGIYTLVVTCIFRFFAEFLSTKFYQLLSKTNAVVSSLVVWIAFSVSNLNFVMQQDTAIFQEPFICIQTEAMVDQTKMRTLWVTFLTCAFLLPLITILILSAVTIHMQAKSNTPSRDRLSNNKSANASNDARTQRELTTMVMASMVVRTVCWLPIQIFVMVDIFGVVGVTELYRKAEMLAVCCALGGSCVSALVYSCVSNDFRLGFQETTSCLFTKKGEPAEKMPPDYKVREDVEVNETIMSILTDSSNHINYA